ncbi:efflux RND transporter periplasmic adaptor subunit [Ensifer adhaerens]|uniref:efflux RND transporter periplasmic adaptor subunit n=1 Tax=Ensifer adhaerens TaxID=106592 RepID=UPI00132F20BE|nr:efflux RND transporter periplasmic adaptor subunit [Ensifer adhaerens]QHG74964.1 efflux RND transporter periplasmic adaptor subunit [Ensifer adhaerens]
MNRTTLFSSIALMIAGGAAAAIFLVQPSIRVEAADPRVAAPLVKIATAQSLHGKERAFTGTVAARVLSNLGFRVPGKILQRHVDVGEKVQAGQPLMRIDETDLRLALTAKRNAVAAARAIHTQARADEQRYAVLVKSGLSASPQRYELAKAALDTAAAQLAAAEADARVAENEATYSLLVADSDGTVVETLGEPGQVVNPGETVIKVAQAGPREAVVWLPETLRLKPGEIAKASVYGTQSKEEAAKLRQISDAADPLTRTYEARWVLGGEAAAAPLGATVKIRIAEEPGAPQAVVPVGSVIDDGRRMGVWIFDEASSVVKFRQVDVEQIGEENAVVSSVTPGERVIALGAHLLTDGATVRTAAAHAGAIQK